MPYQFLTLISTTATAHIDTFFNDTSPLHTDVRLEGLEVRVSNLEYRISCIEATLNNTAYNTEAGWPNYAMGY